MQSDDGKLVGVMTYEYRLLYQAYKEFIYFTLINIKKEDDEIKLYLYNSYAKIILHLYEFLKACVAREISKTQSEDNSRVKSYILVELEKIAKQKKQTFELVKLEEFAEDLRIYRNKVYGHVPKERLEKYPLANFYNKHHVYVVWLIESTEYWWTAEASEVASNSSIQEFSNMLTFGSREPQ
jgi:hypothetical protein